MRIPSQSGPICRSMWALPRVPRSFQGWRRGVNVAVAASEVRCYESNTCTGLYETGPNVSTPQRCCHRHDNGCFQRTDGGIGGRPLNWPCGAQQPFTPGM